MSNSFFYGSPVGAEQFINRRKTLRRVVNRILGSGQSTAIVGEPRMGKTSLLEYLQAPENRVNLYGDEGRRFVFCLIDVQMLGGQFSQAEFWEQALAPLLERVIEPAPSTQLAEHYRICHENNFGTFTLERFFRQLRRDNWRLVLLLDEFDLLLHHPTLNSAEFFGSLRALTSRSRGALAVVTASRQSLTTLNAETQIFNPTGSPYFNVFAEMNLGAFPAKDVPTLLNRAGKGFFPPADRRYIALVAGGHPYLLQLTASAMWDEVSRGENDAYQRHLSVGQRIYQETKFHFADTWRVWSPETRKAITTIALAQVPYLLDKRNFLTQNFVKELPDFSPEINDLKAIGWLKEDDDIPGGYRIAQGAMLWWLADELLRIIRSKTAFETWFRGQHLMGPLSEKELRYLGKAAKFAGELLEQGAVILIEAYAKGLTR